MLALAMLLLCWAIGYKITESRFSVNNHDKHNLPVSFPLECSLPERLGASGRLASPPELSCSQYQCGCSSIAPGSIEFIY